MNKLLPLVATAALAAGLVGPPAHAAPSPDFTAAIEDPAGDAAVMATNEAVPEDLDDRADLLGLDVAATYYGRDEGVYYDVTWQVATFVPPFASDATEGQEQRFEADLAYRTTTRSGDRVDATSHLAVDVEAHGWFLSVTSGTTKQRTRCSVRWDDPQPDSPAGWSYDEEAGTVTFFFLDSCLLGHPRTTKKVHIEAPTTTASADGSWATDTSDQVIVAPLRSLYPGS